MVLLLGSRGQYRGRNASGFVGVLRRIVGSVTQLVGFSRSGRRSEMRARSTSVSGWLALGAAIACFGVGYLVGNSTAKPAVPGAGLNAGGGVPQTPAVIGEIETRPLASQAFIVSAYPGLAADDAKVRAKALADYLRSRQILRARPYEYPAKEGPLWVVAVYHDGEAEEAATRERLRQLPEDVPDATFVHLRKSEAGWPTTWPIR